MYISFKNTGKNNLMAKDLKKQTTCYFTAYLCTYIGKRSVDIMQPSKSCVTNGSNVNVSPGDFEALLLRNKAMIWHICRDYNLGNDWTPEDCMQEVMISLWRSFGSFEGRSSEKTWVWRVATNTMLMLRRKVERTLATKSLEEGMEREADSSSNDDGLRQLNQLIDALPEKEATVIRATLDGFSYKEIADMTGSTVGAVAMRIARTKRKLKQLYEKEN